MKTKIKDLEITNLQTFKNEFETGFIISWECNIGFGELTIIKPIKDGDLELRCESECMSDNNDKEFIQIVFNELIKKLNVIE